MKGRADTWLRRDVAMSLLAAAAILFCTVRLPVVAPAAAPPRLFGAYRVTFGGPGTGTGKAIVTPAAVKIDGTITDEQGNAFTFSAPKLAMDRSTYRFSGTGTLGSSFIKISGRLDPNDKAIKKCRIAATFLATDGKAGRLAGEQN